MRPVIRVLFAAVLAGTGGCSGTHEPPHDRAQLPAASPVQAAPGLDVPELLALSIDEMSKRLGPRLPVPAGFVDPLRDPLTQRSEQVDSSAFFRAQGLAFVASYNHRTRQVSNLVLLGANETDLMRRAQLQLSAEQYLVLPVFQKERPTQLLGLRVLAVSLNQ